MRRLVFRRPRDAGLQRPAHFGEQVTHVVAGEAVFRERGFQWNDPFMREFHGHDRQRLAPGRGLYGLRNMAFAGLDKDIGPARFTGKIPHAANDARLLSGDRTRRFERESRQAGIG